MIKQPFLKIPQKSEIYKKREHKKADVFAIVQSFSESLLNKTTHTRHIHTV